MKIDSLERFYHLNHDNTYRFSGHRHNSYEVNIVFNGCLEITCDDNVFKLNPGELAMWKPGVFHRNCVVSNDITEFISLHFVSSSDDIETGFFGNNKSEKSNSGMTNAVVFELTESDISIVKVIDDEVNRCGIGSEVCLKLLEALFIRLSGKTSVPELATGGNPWVYRKAVRVMNDNISYPLSVSDIARKCGVCTTTLKNAFSECAGKGVGVKSYFLEMKLEKAKKLLLSGQSVEEVSVDLGFSSPAYFSQCFKREIGKNPIEFKVSGHHPGNKTQ